MGSAVTETLIALLLRLSEGAGPRPFPDPSPGSTSGAAFDLLLSAGALEEQAPAEILAGLYRLRVRAGRQADRGDRWIDDGGVSARCAARSCWTTRTGGRSRFTRAVSSPPLADSAARSVGASARPLAPWAQRLGGRALFVTLTRSIVANPALPAVIATHARGPAALIAPAT